MHTEVTPWYILPPSALWIGGQKGLKYRTRMKTNGKLLTFFNEPVCFLVANYIVKWPVHLMRLIKTAVHWHHFRLGMTSESWFALQALMGEMQLCHHSCRVTGMGICSLAHLSCQTFPCTPEGMLTTSISSV